jgi:AbrB family looped-hinge helix DNA binding protein
MPQATLTSKGQITLPKEVRESLGVGTGDRVDFVETAKGVYTVVAAARDIRDLKGLIAKPTRPVTVEAMRRAIAKRASKR